MRIVSYYLDKRRILFQVIRTEDNITINEVIDGGEPKECQIRIGDLVGKNISMDLLE